MGTKQSRLTIGKHLYRVKKWIFAIFFILTVSQIALSQIKADLTLQVSKSFSKVDQLPTLYGAQHFFTPGVLYSGELGIFITKKLRLNIGYGYAMQTDRMKNYKYPLVFHTTYRVFPLLLEYDYFVRNKTTLFCGIGFQYKRNKLEYNEPTPNGLPGIVFFNENNYHTLFRSGVKYSNQNIFLKISAQVDIPVFKENMGNVLYVGLNVGLGVKLDKIITYLFFEG